MQLRRQSVGMLGARKGSRPVPRRSCWAAAAVGDSGGTSGVWKPHQRVLAAPDGASGQHWPTPQQPQPQQCAPRAVPQQPGGGTRPRQRLVLAASGRLPNQADSLFNPSDRDDVNIGLVERVATRSVSDLDYLSVRAPV